MNDSTIKLKIWLETKDNSEILSDNNWELLKSISETSSLKAAMKKQGFTYREAWDNLNKLENFFGFPVIESQRGGKVGGTTVLTPQGQVIVSAFDKFHEKYDYIIFQALQETLNEIKQNIEIAGGK